jgi:RNA polymerase sigma-70 factor, ECF subfamily
MPDPNSEKDLVGRAVAGERAALDYLLAMYLPRLGTSIAPRMPASLRGSIQVEDVLQEVTLEVVRTIGTFQGTEAKSFYTWLCQIAAHRLLDMVRAVRAAKRGGGRMAMDAQVTSMTCLLDRVAVSSRTPSMSAAGHEAASAVRAALERIPESYRLAVRLRYLEGLTPADIAARMGRTEEAVRLLCHRGCKLLAEVLGPASHFLTQKG